MGAQLVSLGDQIKGSPEGKNPGPKSEEVFLIWESSLCVSRILYMCVDSQGGGVVWNPVPPSESMWCAHL